MEQLKNTNTSTHESAIHVRTIQLLDQMLEEILFTHGGYDLVNSVKNIRILSEAWINSDFSESALGDIKSEISGLSVERRQDVIRAFAAHLQLVNVAEQNTRMRRHLAYTLEDAKISQPYSIERTIAQLKEDGYSSDDIRAAIPHLSIQLIITAHPTESTKRSILDIKKRLSLRLKELDNPTLTEKEIIFIKENILNEVAILWQSNELSDKKVGVLDEVRNGLYYFDNTLFDVLPDIHRELEISLRKHFPDEKWKIPNFLRFGSWIGGDRDGNPFVTHDITWQTLTLQRELIISKYLSAFDYLINRYSFCTTRIHVSDELIKLIDEKEGKYLEDGQKWPTSTEMYRRALTFMRYRLTQTGVSEAGYKNPGELLSELFIIKDSLKQHLPSKDELRHINRTIRQIGIFGFHLASLEARNHSGVHETAIGEILAKVNITQDYVSLDEEEKQKILLQVLQNPRPLLLRWESYSDETNEVIATFNTIKKAHDMYGSVALPTYIISMTHTPSDLLEALVFAKEAGLYYLHPDGSITSTLKITPLFETIGDLAAGQATIEKMFTIPIYRDHLKLLDNYQQIMVGYSDGSKDGGTLTAQWKIYNAQIEINKLAKENGIHVEFFHGRGGSLGRGGNPLNRSIVSQPPSTSVNGIKITEQGEVMSTRYLLPEIGFRNLEQATSTLLKTVTVTLKGEKNGDDPQLKPEWIESLNEVSEAAFEKYRSLVFDDGKLFEYYNEVSPLKNFANLNIGSRPMHRVAKPSFHSLRAIPWVFGWMQNRQLIPAWYAAGTGLTTFAEAKPENIDKLQKMYEEWPLFTAMLNNLQSALMKADMKTASAYIPLASDQDSAKKIFENITSEYEKTKKIVMQIAQVDELLERYPESRTSVLTRAPYINALNFMQVDLLKTLRSDSTKSEEDEAKLSTLILLTINGVVAGLQNIG